MHILIIGAHPDDGAIYAGGCAALWRRRGDAVRFLSLTDGSRSHYDPRYARDPQELAQRCAGESEASAAVIGATCRNVGLTDAAVYVDKEVTETLVREIRDFGPSPGAGPDLIVTNRPTDRPRDHYYGAHMVIDAAGMTAMPLVCPDVPALTHVPTVAYWHDDYSEFWPFRADMIISIDSAIEDKTLLVAEHVSQVFEWLPYNRGLLDHVPVEPLERLAWLRHGRIEPMASRVRSACAESLHANLPHGRYAEAYQISEYGRQPTASERAALFP
jgi:LmbE family N-acetylglucosaminyl deacetylase